METLPIHINQAIRVGVKACKKDSFKFKGFELNDIKNKKTYNVLIDDKNEGLIRIIDDPESFDRFLQSKGKTYPPNGLIFNFLSHN